MSLEEDYARAIAFYQSRQLDAAKAVCETLIAQVPNAPGLFNLLGVIALDQNDCEAAVQALGRSVQLNPSDAAALHNLGNAFRRLSRLEPAEACYSAALGLVPLQFASALDRGIVRLALGRADEALSDLVQAADGLSGFAEAPFQLGLAYVALSRLPEAEVAFRRALSMDAGHIPALTNLLTLLSQSFRWSECLDVARRLTVLEPGNPEHHRVLAAVLAENGQAAAAMAAAEQAIDLAPHAPKPLILLARLLHAEGRYDRAVSLLDRAIALDPANNEARVVRSVALNDSGDWPEALAEYDRVLACDPNHAMALVLRCVTEIPVNYATEEQIFERRAAFDIALARLEAWFAGADEVARRRLSEAIDVTQPFLLTAQGLNDRDLMARYGALTCQVMATFQPPFPRLRRASGERVRLGVVSGCFRVYTAWKILIEGYVTKLDPARIELFCYYTRSGGDENTERAREASQHFVGGKRPIEAWIKQIVGDQPHALLYPDIFMEPMTNRLAALRLAPVQIALGAHPETTGMPTIDYHISSDLMEPPDAQDHYTEKLIRLPNLATCFTPLVIEAEALDRDAFGIPADAIIYWSCQSMHKYLPQFDWLYGRIAQRVERAFFLFLEQGPQHRANDVFRERMEREIGPIGQRWILLPKLRLERFYGFAQASDVFLDTVGWSGNTTVMESLSAALPVVTWPQALMRGRHAAAILTRIGVTETIAASGDEYVEIAARLGNDPEWRAVVSARMLENRHLAFNDLAPIRAFEDFLYRVVPEASA